MRPEIVVDTRGSRSPTCSVDQMTRRVSPFAILALAIEELTFTDRIPVVRDIAVDWEDRIWVERTGEGGQGPRPNNILTPDDLSLDGQPGP